MRVVKPPILTPTKLVANLAEAEGAMPPRQSRLGLQFGVSWGQDHCLTDPTNPQCPLESTDSNFDNSLFPFPYQPAPTASGWKGLAKRVVGLQSRLPHRWLPLTLNPSPPPRGERLAGEAVLPAGRVRGGALREMGWWAHCHRAAIMGVLHFNRRG